MKAATRRPRKSSGAWKQHVYPLLVVRDVNAYDLWPTTGGARSLFGNRTQVLGHCLFALIIALIWGAPVIGSEPDPRLWIHHDFIDGPYRPLFSAGVLLSAAPSAPSRLELAICAVAALEQELERLGKTVPADFVQRLQRKNSKKNYYPFVEDVPWMLAELARASKVPWGHLVHVAVQGMVENSGVVAEYVNADDAKDSAEPFWNVQYRGDGIAVAKITDFNRAPGPGFGNQLRGVRHELGLILDLRNSRGGRLDTILRLADLFVRSGKLLTIVRNGDDETFKATKDKTEPMYPLVILIDSRTSAGAGIVAAILQDRERALLVGETTSVLERPYEETRILSATRLRVPVGDCYLPSKRPTSGVSIQPNVSTPVVEESLVETVNAAIAHVRGMKLNDAMREMRVYLEP